jgi:L-ascorbate metabolism protein UlaG (beta-lactamase superfamily)
MLGSQAAPLPFAPRRFPAAEVLAAADLPPVDAVVISHDHFDHLDHATIRAIAPRVGRFLVPLGVGAHLERWGVAPERISELDWGDSAVHAGFTFVCAPARHFSGRGLTDQFRTLWASWVIKTGRRRIFNSGDSGYGPHFRAIGAAHGPFDIAFIECGQYDARWESIHMMADQSARAAVEVGARLMLPIHWGAYALAMHSWYDPIEKVTAAARAAGIPIATPRLGEPVALDGSAPASRAWWKEAP